MKWGDLYKAPKTEKALVYSFKVGDKVKFRKTRYAYTPFIYAHEERRKKKMHGYIVGISDKGFARVEMYLLDKKLYTESFFFDELIKKE